MSLESTLPKLELLCLLYWPGPLPDSQKKQCFTKLVPYKKKCYKNLWYIYFCVECWDRREEFLVAYWEFFLSLVQIQHKFVWLALNTPRTFVDMPPAPARMLSTRLLSPCHSPTIPQLAKQHIPLVLCPRGYTAAVKPMSFGHARKQQYKSTSDSRKSGTNLTYLPTSNSDAMLSLKEGRLERGVLLTQACAI